MASVLQNLLERLGLRNSEDEEYIQENFGADAATVGGSVYGSVGIISFFISLWLIYNNRKTFMPPGRSKLVTILYMLLVLGFNSCFPPLLPIVLVVYYGFSVMPLKENSTMAQTFGKNFFK
jgi:hypothetical protein